MSRIDRLSPEQTAQLPVYRDRWLAIGLSTAPCAPHRIRMAVAHAYRCAGLAPPVAVVCVGSPLAGLIAANILGAQVRDQVEDQVEAQVRDQVWDQVGTQVRDQVWHQVGAQVGAQVWHQVGAQVWHQVGAQVRDQVGTQVWHQVGTHVRDQVEAHVWTQVRDQVGAQVRDQVEDQVRDQVRDQVEDQVRAQVRGQVEACRVEWMPPCYGQHDASWLGYYDYFGACCALERLVQRLHGLMNLARQAGWWWPSRRVAIVSSRPSSLHRDAEGNLHHETGPAIGYPDGWGVWALHGVRVTEQIVMAPETLDVPRISGESNVEVRRVMLDRFGWDRFLRESGARAINADERFGVLYRTELRDDEPLVMVKVLNGTTERDGSRKPYFLRVPPTIETAEAAVAWTFDVPAGDYRPAEET